MKRIIPARAGFTLRAAGEPDAIRDHPRSRGVYRTLCTRSVLDEGSSPLARGLLRIDGHEISVAGIIPARAGFTPPRTSPMSSRADHPRSRGVYSPEPRRPPTLPRIIPARAGFTCDRRSESLLRKDHPRSRGVYSKTHFKLPGGRGSSPLARGLLIADGTLGWAVGIIPARAGFTRTVRPTVRGIRDHPRSRGVYAVVAAGAMIAGGSSPLARGLRRGRLGGSDGLRIIPARAGFTPAANKRRP